MMRWLGYVIGCFIAGVIALNLYFFAAIASWQWLDPSSSAFMRAERMRLCGANVFTCRIDLPRVSRSGSETLQSGGRSVYRFGCI